MERLALKQSPCIQHHIDILTAHKLYIIKYFIINVSRCCELLKTSVRDNRYYYYRIVSNENGRENRIVWFFSTYYNNIIILHKRPTLFVGGILPRSIYPDRYNNNSCYSRTLLEIILCMTIIS